MKPDDQASRLLAEIVAEFVERRRSGENPDIGEYRRKYPQLAEEIEGQLRMIELLEGGRDPQGDSRPSSVSPGCHSLGEVLAGQPLPIQRLIFLRNFEKRSWKQIAETIGRPERDLRLTYSRVLRELMDWFACAEREGP